MASDIDHEAPKTIVDHARIRLEVVLLLSRFAAVPTIVQETGFMAVLPWSVVRRSVGLARLQVLPYSLFPTESTHDGLALSAASKPPERDQ